jgi:hypothetical protein
MYLVTSLQEIGVLLSMFVATSLQEIKVSFFAIRQELNAIVISTS